MAEDVKKEEDKAGGEKEELVLAHERHGWPQGPPDYAVKALQTAQTLASQGPKPPYTPLLLPGATLSGSGSSASDRQSGNDSDNAADRPA